MHSILPLILLVAVGGCASCSSSGVQIQRTQQASLATLAPAFDVPASREAKQAFAEEFVRRSTSKPFAHVRALLEQDGAPPLQAEVWMSAQQVRLQLAHKESDRVFYASYSNGAHFQEYVPTLKLATGKEVAPAVLTHMLQEGGWSVVLGYEVDCRLGAFNRTWLADDPKATPVFMGEIIRDSDEASLKTIEGVECISFRSVVDAGSDARKGLLQVEYEVAVDRRTLSPVRLSNVVVHGFKREKVSPLRVRTFEVHLSDSDKDWKWALCPTDFQLSERQSHDKPAD